jgi:hypothetical protein
MNVLYVGLNWGLCLATAALLAVCFFRYRYLFIKPSFIVILFFHLQIQWAGTIKSGEIFFYLPEPVSFALLLHGFPLIGLGVSFFIAHRDARLILQRVVEAESLRVNGNILLILLAVIGTVTLLYFYTVPFSQTGLYTLFHNPQLSKYAREESLKLIANPVVRYGFIFLREAFVPILFTLSAFLGVFAVEKRRFLRAAGWGLLGMILLILVSVSGARSPALFVILTALFALYLRKGMKVRLVYILLLVVLLISIPTAISIVREGRSFAPDIFWTYLSKAIANRIFFVPLNVSLYHVHFAQTGGFFGLAAVPKLAYLFNIEPINVANFIFSKYTHYGLESGLANACYVFTYYSYFGLSSIVFSLMGLWMLDLAIPVFKRIKNNFILIAAVAATFNSCLSFVRSDYTTALITGGFMIVLIVTFVLDRLDAHLSWPLRFAT